MKNFDKNIPRLYLIKISKWFNMVMPVVVLFYQDNGMNMQEIFTLKAIYSVAIVAMEVPSGWMADVWGRKKTLFIGSLLGASGFLIYSFSFGFWAFVVAEIVLGVGHAFVSGADSAMLYDSLKASGKTEKYIKHEGRIASAGNFAEAIAGVVGGLLAAVSLRTPFYFQFVVAAIAIPAAFTLAEPKIHSIEHIHSIPKMVKNIRNTLANNHDLRISILLSATTGAATLTFAWLVQPYFIEIGLPVEMYGVFWTVLNLTVGFSSVFAHRVEVSLGRTTTLYAIIAMISIGYFLSGILISWWGMAFLFMFYLVRGVATPIFKNYINQFAQSEIRATILSVRDFTIRIIFAVIGPFLGWITDNISLKSAFLLAGGIYLVSVILVVLPWIKRSGQNN
ncbi:MAG: MFS transporter [Bacteroidetes bacterium]|nr:MAG: MFS transporter [Bacteroidota bacterium]